MLDNTNLIEYLHGKHEGKGLLELIEEINKPSSLVITVEYLYECTDEKYWSMLDNLLEHREDLQDRIKRYKESRVA